MIFCNFQVKYPIPLSHNGQPPYLPSSSVVQHQIERRQGLEDARRSPRLLVHQETRTSAQMRWHRRQAQGCKFYALLNNFKLRRLFDFCHKSFKSNFYFAAPSLATEAIGAAHAPSQEGLPHIRWCSLRCRRPWAVRYCFQILACLRFYHFGGQRSVAWSTKCLAFQWRWWPYTSVFHLTLND